MFKVGQRVRFKDEVGEGVITAISSKGKVSVLTDEGFENVYEEKLLVSLEKEEMPVVEKKSNDFSVENKKAKRGKKNVYSIQRYIKQDKLSGRKRSEPYAEIDLHLEELIEFPNRLQAHQKIQLQIEVFKKYLYQAKEIRLRKVIFIHGVGQGTLKAELRNMLKEQSNIEFSDADFQKYGKGATEVRIKGLFR